MLPLRTGPRALLALACAAAVTRAQSPTPTRTPSATATAWAIVGNAFHYGELGQLPVALTQPAANQAGAAWFAGQFWADSFTATYTFRLEYPSSPMADGMAFVLHRDPRGLAAIGGTGGSIGYSGIINSVAVRISTFQGGTNFSFGVSTGGVVGASFAGVNVDSQPGRLNFASGNWFETTVRFSRSVTPAALQVTIRELGGTGTSRNATFPVDVIAALGCTVGVQGCLAFGGFTAGCGGSWARFIVGSLTVSSLEPTQTPTASCTPSPSASVSLGLTPSNTNTPSNTPTRTRTATQTSTPSQTPSSTATAWRVNGNAVAAGGNQLPVTLTSATANQGGSAVWPGQVWADAFSIRVQIRVDLPTGGGADGMAIWLSNDARMPSAVGSSGGGLGYSGIARSIGVRFDTYGSSSAAPSLGLVFNGSIPTASGEFTATTNPAAFNWVDGNTYDVTWAYSTFSGAPNSVGNMTLRVQQMVAGGATRWFSWPTINIFSFLCAGGATQGCSAFFGASAGTGGSTARHTLVSYSYTPLRATLTPTGTASPSITPSSTPSTSFSSSITPSTSATPSASVTAVSITASPSGTPSTSPTGSNTPSASVTPQSLSRTPPATASPSGTPPSTMSGTTTPSPSLWAAVGNTYFMGSQGTLPAAVTPPLGYQTGALWHPYPLLTDEFRMRVVLRVDSLPSAGNIADGLAWVWHRDGRGLTAIGQTGGMVGVGATTGVGIANASALRWDTYDGTNSRCTYGYLPVAGGNLPLAGEFDLTGKITLWSGNDIEVNITYSRTTGVMSTLLTELFPDNSGTTYPYSWSGINLASTLGCGTAPPVGTCAAWVGMTAATGGRWARQMLRSFSYENLQPSPSATSSSTSSPTATPPNTPTGSITASITPSSSATQVGTTSPTSSNSPSASTTPSGTPSPSQTPSASGTGTVTPSTTGTPSPTRTPSFIVSGDARATSGLPPLTLTRSLIWSMGGAFWGEPLIADGFRVTFTVRGVATVGVSPADGMAFVVHRDPRGPTALGGMGGALGYAAGGNSLGAALPGITNGLAVRFDTIPSSSIGLLQGPAAPSDSGEFVTAGAFDWAGGIDYDVEVNYRVGGNLTATVTDGGTTRTYAWAGVNIRAALGCPLGVQGCRGFFGFTAATGGAYAQFSVRSWSYANTMPTNTPTSSVTPTASGTASPSTTPASLTQSVTPTSSATATPTSSATSSSTPSPTATATSWATVWNAQWGAAPGQLPIVLTNTSLFMRGAAWWPGRVVVDEFVWRARIIIDQAGGSGADGMTLTLHNDPRGAAAVGAAGGALGYAASGTIGGITRSVGVRLDTFGSSGHACSVGLLTGGAAITAGFAEYASPSEFASGMPYNVELRWSAVNNSLRAVVQEEKLGGLTTTYSWTVDVRAALGCTPGALCYAFYGFTAATGATSERHAVHASEFVTLVPSLTPTSSVTPSITASTSLSATNTPSASVTPSNTPSGSITASGSSSATHTQVSTPSTTSTPSPSFSKSASITASLTPSASITASASGTGSASRTATPTPTPTASASAWFAGGFATHMGSLGQLPIALTSATANIAGSAFWPGRVSVDAFTWRTTVRMDRPSGGGADGMVLLLHNDPRGVLALGSTGGSLGYAGSSTDTTIPGVALSVGIRLDAFSTTHASTVGLVTGGSFTGVSGSFTSPSDFSSGLPYDVTLTYSATNHNLTAVITEVKAGGITRAYSWTVNVKTAVGCSASVVGCFAYYGVTAATGWSYQRHLLEASSFLSTWPSLTPTPSNTPTNTASPSQTATQTPSPSSTQVLSLSPTSSLTATPTNTASPSGTTTQTGTQTPSPTATRSATASATAYAIAGSAFWQDPVNGEGQLPILLTDGAPNRAGSAFWPGRVYVDAFSVNMRFALSQITSASVADGLAFVVHNDPRGAVALGASGGALGLGGGPGIPAITPSLAIVFDTWSASATRSTLGMVTGGGPVPDAGQYDMAGVFSWPSRNVFAAVVTYTHATRSLVATVTEERSGGLTRAFNWTVDLKAAVGCDSAVQGCYAFFGATAATGGSYAAHVLHTLDFVNVAPSSSPTPSNTPSGSGTPSVTSTPASITQSATPTSSASCTPSETATGTGTPSSSRTATPTGTATTSATATRSPTRTPTGTRSATSSASATRSATSSVSPSRSATLSGSSTRAATPTPTVSRSRTPSASCTTTGSMSATATETPSASASDTGTASSSATSTGTGSPSATGTGSSSGSVSGTGSSSASSTGSPSGTGTPAATRTRTAAATPSRTAPSSGTATKTRPPVMASRSATATKTRTPTATRTKTRTKSKTPSKKRKLRV